MGMCFDYKGKQYDLGEYLDLIKSENKALKKKLKAVKKWCNENPYSLGATFRGYDLARAKVQAILLEDHR